MHFWQTWCFMYIYLQIFLFSVLHLLIKTTTCIFFVLTFLSSSFYRNIFEAPLQYLSSEIHFQSLWLYVYWAQMIFLLVCKPCTCIVYIFFVLFWNLVFMFSFESNHFSKWFHYPSKDVRSSKKNLTLCFFSPVHVNVLNLLDGKNFACDAIFHYWILK